MIPYGHQFIDKEDIEAVLEVLKSDWLTQGPKIQEFEKALAKYCGAKFAVVCSSGTSALHLAYLAAGLKKGDEVITSPNTFAATANMLLAVGAKPVFCDIRLDTYNVDETKIEALITSKTKAIVPVHFAGQPCEMDKIIKIAKKHKLIVIEDACHALGAKYKNSKIGNCRYSDMAVFSFHPVKSITTGEGGAILTNNEKYYKKLISFRSHGIHKDEKGKNVMTELGYNYRLTDIQAALGISQLKKLDKFIKARHQVAAWYLKELKGLKEISLPSELKHVYSSWHIFIIRTKNSGIRDGLASFLKENGIGVNFHYPCVYRHPYYQENGYKKTECLNAEEYESTTITMPIYPGLSQKKLNYIASRLRKFLIDRLNIKIKTKKIYGERIYLRQLKETDASSDYSGWLNDREVNKYLATRKITIDELKKYIKEKNASGSCLLLGIFCNEEHIGNIKLEAIDHKKGTAEIGILIGNKNYWGKGIGKEATKLVLDYAFGELNLNEICLGVVSGNKAAIKLYKDVGFEIRKINKKARNHDGVLYDEIIMTIRDDKYKTIAA